MATLNLPVWNAAFDEREITDLATSIEEGRRASLRHVESTYTFGKELLSSLTDDVLATLSNEQLISAAQRLEEQESLEARLSALLTPLEDAILRQPLLLLAEQEERLSDLAETLRLSADPEVIRHFVDLARQAETHASHAANEGATDWRALLASLRD